MLSWAWGDRKAPGVCRNEVVLSVGRSSPNLSVVGLRSGLRNQLRLSAGARPDPGYSWTAAERSPLRRSHLQNCPNSSAWRPRSTAVRSLGEETADVLVHRANVQPDHLVDLILRPRPASVDDSMSERVHDVHAAILLKCLHYARPDLAATRPCIDESTTKTCHYLVLITGEVDVEGLGVAAPQAGRGTTRGRRSASMRTVGKVEPVM